MNGEMAAGGGAEVAPAINQVAYVPFDFKVGVFVGRPQSPNDPHVEEWARDIKSLFKSWQTPADQQSQLLMKYLSGEAKRVVMVMEPVDREDSQVVLERLLEVYGDKTPTSSLLQIFHSRKQRREETVKEFSLALQEIAGRIKKRDPEALAKQDEMLRDQFVHGLQNQDVLRSLRSALRQKPTLKFSDVLAEAIHLTADHEESVNVRTVESRLENPQPPALLKTLQDVVQRTVEQQREMAEMMSTMRKELNQLCISSPRGSYQKRPRRQPRWDDQGNPICLNCDKPGHMARECPEDRKRYMTQPPQNQGYYQSSQKPSPLN